MYDLESPYMYTYRLLLSAELLKINFVCLTSKNNTNRPKTCVLSFDKASLIWVKHTIFLSGLVRKYPQFRSAIVQFNYQQF